MQDLKLISRESARSLLGLCFDVDDTVTHHGTLDPDAYRSMFELKASGLKLIAVTGRPLGFAEVIARTWPVDAAVGENGAGFLARQGNTLRSGYWDPVELRVHQQQTLARIRVRVATDFPDIAVSSDAWARRCDLAFDIGEQASVPPDQIDRLLALIEAEGAHANVSSIHVHAQLGSHDKARGVTHVAHELWGLAAARVQESFAFIGDSGNDAAAFAFFLLTIGVANVRQHLTRLPTPPAFVTEASHGAGFAELARQLVALRAAGGA
ncbi:MAG: haloacid dehalogenase-like hydrolase [Myxococcaceae bacterium]|nr:haloacid dehalogenase-like hydrolase [Myxococcaceae bacterium]